MSANHHARHSHVILLSTSLFAQTATTQNSHTTENLRGLSTPAAEHRLGQRHSRHLSPHHSTPAIPGSPPKSPAPSLSTSATSKPSTPTSPISSLPAPETNPASIKPPTPAKPGPCNSPTKTPRASFDCMAFWNPDHGIALGDPVNNKFELISTEDGGKHLEAHPARQSPARHPRRRRLRRQWNLHCCSRKEKRLVCYRRKSRPRISFHRRWQELDRRRNSHRPRSRLCRHLLHRLPRLNHGAIAGGDYQHPEKDGPNLAFTNDAGRTWILAPISPQWYFSAVAFTNRVGTAALGSARRAKLGSLGPRYRPRRLRRHHRRQVAENLGTQP